MRVLKGFRMNLDSCDGSNPCIAKHGQTWNVSSHIRRDATRWIHESLRVWGSTPSEPMIFSRCVYVPSVDQRQEQLQLLCQWTILAFRTVMTLETDTTTLPDDCCKMLAVTLLYTVYKLYIYTFIIIYNIHLHLHIHICIYICIYIYIYICTCIHFLFETVFLHVFLALGKKSRQKIQKAGFILFFPWYTYQNCSTCPLWPFVGLRVNLSTSFLNLNTCTTRPLSFVLGIKSPTPCESEHLQPSASICGLGTVRHCVARSLFHHLLSSHSTLHPIPHSTVYTGPVTGEESTIRLK